MLLDVEALQADVSGACGIVTRSIARTATSLEDAIKGIEQVVRNHTPQSASQEEDSSSSEDEGASSTLRDHEAPSVYAPWASIQQNVRVLWQQLLWKSNLQLARPYLWDMRSYTAAEKEVEAGRSLVKAFLSCIRTDNAHRRDTGLDARATEIALEDRLTRQYYDSRAKRDSLLRGVRSSTITQAQFDDIALRRIGITEALPTFLRPGKSVSCAMCTAVDQVWIQQPSLYLKHLLEHFLPYSCTYSPCAVDNIFRDTKAWIDHESSVHRLGWACPDCPWDLCATYATSDGFRDHLRTTHRNELDESDIRVVIMYSRESLPDDRISCPLCWKAPPFEEGTHSGHLASHFESLLMLALYE
ncbi:hypothetical protein LTR56_025105 [Elasticomyces elasticus]|nr:hypothetical protein LTR56_025105 [Elasticomyces elasticus]KAK3663259.1 hypothetical protein LTR22_005917 [Elasticomyces elasticus]KAK4929084.1 hypothetical protein LTR49_004281 [Elasticomyces elasticus]KAK5766463.1 hypothetical protein LTS12_003380 [Elasticomyces elasticus]